MPTTRTPSSTPTSPPSSTSTSRTDQPSPSRLVDREQQPVDALVLGSGVAGLTAAIRAASDGLRVGVLTKGKLTESATRWAQGGVAAGLSSEEDSTDLHLADLLAAGVCRGDYAPLLVLGGTG